MTTNYRQVFAMKKQREDTIRKMCPKITNGSGIYMFYRVDESGIRRAYVGQALHLCERCAAHLGEFDHLGLSLKKWKAYDPVDNPHGWQLTFGPCPVAELDKREIATIKHVADRGYQLYNISSGGQGVGKKITGDYKRPKTYMQGVERGYIKASKEISHLFDLHLKVSKKSDRPNKNQDKALEKFQAFLDYHKLKEGSEENET